MNIELLKDKDLCTGCWACFNVCPVDCISMPFDDEGFRYPEINHDRCIKCRKCIEVCPIYKVNDFENYDIPDFYTAISKDKVSLNKSSSGGVFSLLAMSVMKNNGAVYGCVLNEDLCAKHIRAENYDSFCPMRGSKYVQSDIDSIYRNIHDDLNNKKEVLFSGTPCQIAGLKHFLNKKEYSNLLLVEVICHGVPSPVLFRKHIDRLESTHKGKIINYEFRSKRKYGWGSENRTYFELKKHNLTRSYYPLFPEYFTAFFYGISLRPSCYKCKYATPKRMGDITLGDFWGYWAKYKKYFPEGISIVAINNSRGKKALNIISDELILDRANFDEASCSNMHFYKPAKKWKIRDKFYVDINRIGYSNIFKKVYLDFPNKKMILRTLYGRFIPNMIRVKIKGVINSIFSNKANSTGNK